MDVPQAGLLLEASNLSHSKDALLHKGKLLRYKDKYFLYIFLPDSVCHNSICLLVCLPFSSLICPKM